mmetsp:Transcript_18562/g.38135  ORF Transcript_18562/g.38135 Transcript_18562/m.38135 type:complete len:390 (+) Transcript_18562:169-1338(+)
MTTQDDYDNNSSSSNDTVHTDDDEFTEFITSQWKDSVEIGLVVTYPLPSTNYCRGFFEDDDELDEDDNNNYDDEDELKAEQEEEESKGTNNNNTSNTYINNDNSSLPPLRLSTALSEQSIAPLFDGTQWAGTRVWKAAVLGLEYLVRERQRRRRVVIGVEGTGAPQRQQQQLPLFSSLLELGCGLGVPGMVWKQLLDHEYEQNQQQQSLSSSCNNDNRRVILTDRESLVSQLQDNIRTNFVGDATSLNSNLNSIEAKVLDWSKEGIGELLRHERQLFHDAQQQQHNDDTTTKALPPLFDVCLNCDCVYEPLYGRAAWESLADVLTEIAVQSPGTLLVTALERRNQDNVEGFLHRLEASGVVEPIQRVVRHDDDPHHVIEIYVTKGNNGV